MRDMIGKAPRQLWILYVPIAGNRYDEESSKIVTMINQLQATDMMDNSATVPGGAATLKWDLICLSSRSWWWRRSWWSWLSWWWGLVRELDSWNLTWPHPQHNRDFYIHRCFCIWINVMFPKGWTARENGNGKDFLTMMELNSPRYSCSANGCGDGWNGSDGFNEKIWQTIIFGQCRGIWE